MSRGSLSPNFPTLNPKLKVFFLFQIKNLEEKVKQHRGNHYREIFQP